MLRKEQDINRQNNYETRQAYHLLSQSDNYCYKNFVERYYNTYY